MRTQKMQAEGNRLVTSIASNIYAEDTFPPPTLPCVSAWRPPSRQRQGFASIGQSLQQGEQLAAQ